MKGKRKKLVRFSDAGKSSDNVYQSLRSGRPSHDNVPGPRHSPTPRHLSTLLDGDPYKKMIDERVRNGVKRTSNQDPYSIFNLLNENPVESVEIAERREYGYE
jgi:hypothetical protein